MTTVALLPISWGEFDPDPVLRGIMVMMHFGLVKSPQLCALCHGRIRFVQKKDGGRNTYRYRWCCCKPHDTCSWMQGVNTYGFLTQLRLESWLPFMDYRVEKVYAELTAFGVGTTQIDVWKKLYWNALSNCLRNGIGPGCGVMVGGKGERVVVDEASFGKNTGISKGPQQPHGHTDESKIAKRLPAQTIWKKGAKMTRSWKRKGKKMVMKHSMKQKKTRAAVPMKKKKVDGRKHGNWVWCAVEVGSLKAGVKTHGAGTKRSVFQLLPKPTRAVDGKPRGTEAIKEQLRLHVRKGSTLVADGWKATEKGVKALGYRMAPPVKHNLNFRDPLTGYHTNDAESEINRVKAWTRRKYAKLGGKTSKSADPDGPDPIIESHLDEFMYLKNVGSDIDTVMKAFVFANGGACPARNI